MVKALSGTTLILGIAEANIDKMKKDLPVKVNLKEMGIEGREITDVVIFYGKDDQDLYNQMKPGINPLKTIIHSDQYKQN